MSVVTPVMLSVCVHTYHGFRNLRLYTSALRNDFDFCNSSFCCLSWASAGIVSTSFTHIAMKLRWSRHCALAAIAVLCIGANAVSACDDTPPLFEGITSTGLPILLNATEASMCTLLHFLPFSRCSLPRHTQSRMYAGTFIRLCMPSLSLCAVSAVPFSLKYNVSHDGGSFIKRIVFTLLLNRESDPAFLPRVWRVAPHMLVRNQGAVYPVLRILP